MPNFLFTKEPQESGEEDFDLTSVIKAAVDAKLLDTHTCFPARVVAYDKEGPTVDCVPVLKKKFPDGRILEMPKIPKVPVMFQRTSAAIIAMPIQVGDYVMLHFTERSIDKWMQTGGTVDPEDVRKHHLSDAYAVAGLFPYSNKADLNNDQDIIIKNTRSGKKTEIRIKQNGKFQVINQTDELIRLLYRFVKAIAGSEAVVLGSTGPQPLRHFEFAEILAKLETFVEKKD